MCRGSLQHGSLQRNSNIESYYHDALQHPDGLPPRRRLQDAGRKYQSLHARERSSPPVPTRTMVSELAELLAYGHMNSQAVAARASATMANRDRVQRLASVAKLSPVATKALYSLPRLRDVPDHRQIVFVVAATGGASLARAYDQGVPSPACTLTSLPFVSRQAKSDGKYAGRTRSVLLDPCFEPQPTQESSCALLNRQGAAASVAHSCDRTVAHSPADAHSKCDNRRDHTATTCLPLMTRSAKQRGCEQPADTVPGLGQPASRLVSVATPASNAMLCAR